MYDAESKGSNEVYITQIVQLLQRVAGESIVLCRYIDLLTSIHRWGNL